MLNEDTSKCADGLPSWITGVSWTANALLFVLSTVLVGLLCMGDPAMAQSYGTSGLGGNVGLGGVYVLFFFWVIVFGVAGFIIDNIRGALWGIIFGPVGLGVAATLRISYALERKSPQEGHNPLP